MAVKFEDYYKTLGVKRDASQDDIQRAFRKLARKYHPDMNKTDDGSARFKRVNEAYEVLKDPDKRKRYDTLGENWKAGQEFRPPPGWEGRFRGAGGPGGAGGRAGSGGGGFQFQAGGQFSDFFEAMFGQMQGGNRGGSGAGFEDLFGARAGSGTPQPPPLQEAPITISLDEAFHGSTRRLDLQGPAGRKTLEVKIPKGTAHGAKIRLGREGLLLNVSVAPHPSFTLTGRDLTTDVKIAPWQAALGDRIDVKTMDGTVSLNVPPGTSSGQKLRLKGKGLPSQKGKAGDLFVRLLIAVPKEISERERELYEQLKNASGERPKQS
jgi:curved DNA-binding protein